MRVVLTFTEFVWVAIITACLIDVLCKAVIGWMKGKKNDYLKAH